MAHAKQLTRREIGSADSIRKAIDAARHVISNSKIAARQGRDDEYALFQQEAEDEMVRAINLIERATQLGATSEQLAPAWDAIADAQAAL